ncbi:MAG: FG-GAP-like repeat-containing protein [Candidatus Cloacimonetes bacterium]|nr:FG-GAP-like repeat-containing protein [Candidatus Cloacimonadota bacterium]
MTVEAWIKVDQFNAGSQGIVTKGDNSWKLKRRGTTDYINFSLSGVDNARGSINVNDSLWHHIAGVYDGSTMILYVDGVWDVSKSVSGTIDLNDDAVQIGDNSNLVDGEFEGYIDEVRIWSIARTQSEIVNNMYLQFNGDETGLVAYYNFNQGEADSSNTDEVYLVDNSLNNNYGILNNFALTDTTSNWVETTIFPFAETDLGDILGIWKVTGDWGDYDGDGDLDFAITGVTTTNSSYSQIYRNDGNDVFVQSAGLTPQYDSSVVWGDFDNDNDLDIINSGTRTNCFINIYRNDGNDTFTEQEDLVTDLTALHYGELCLGDYDNDGDMDYFTSGSDHYQTGFSKSILVRNEGNGEFKEMGYQFPGLWRSHNTWGDYDGDLDILLMGQDSVGVMHTKLYRNDVIRSNTIPIAPASLQAVVSNDSITFSWDSGSDSESPSIILTYNLRVGTSSDGTDIITPLADPATGKRYVVAYGNQYMNTSWTIQTSLTGFQLPPTLYWSVQTIDSGFAGSDFALEQTIDLGETLYPTISYNYEMSLTDRLFWETDQGSFIIGYQV